MLKSTHKPVARLAPPPLPPGWAEYEAPTGTLGLCEVTFVCLHLLTILGHPYYYNDSTKQSTYARPLPTLQPAEQYSNQAAQITTEQSQNGDGTNTSLSMAGMSLTPGDIGNHPHGNSNTWRGRGNSRGGFPNHHKFQPRDRAKSKYGIPGCESWVLVKTKLGRRFVYNTQNDESFWRIPPNVMKGVNELDKQEQYIQARSDNKELGALADHGQASAQMEVVTAVNGNPTATPAPGTSTSINHETERPMLDSDGEEYEEVEVTDDEEDENPVKRQKTESENAEQPIEFNEEDIEFQLAAMGQSYGLEPGEYGDGDGEELEEGAEGLDLTEDDAKALFRDMLKDHGISPYTTWETIVEAGYLVEDERYTVLPNMRSRKDVWGEWTRDTIRRLKEQRQKEDRISPSCRRTPRQSFTGLNFGESSRESPRCTTPNCPTKIARNGTVITSVASNFQKLL